ncbi:GNAT family N-acetyltransferase [Subsaximicrobium wynnwilliamsii]|uniref:GNAT family N-acetyltransferase n=1 Tax=Subsaximicrobium wynnwilliamsii TaxID=291179 RepID=A0A5C6ZGR4_9FLAO|nr:GNAT family N-acetyltransferase [Subsaximicrobium wynnwilliamsii]TXD83353.1 GNAT family N-acetyltransferase [Subsaximicrobium wynnwilliamsii]TXD89110.1 GNAT family N-acetyltransferase [Subsaximicrobium wynnwilliamsii]TXE03377.1 GNAT family N-acetyltransferase [Subsaximicrobium wynnwilliamsii]
MDIDYREATLEDLPEITAIFRDTISTVNRKHYSEEQVEAWAAAADNLKKWQKRIKATYFLVAENDGQILGFAWLKNGNYLEGMYVHKNYQRKTVGSKLLRIIESHVTMYDFESIQAESSLSSLPFFDSHYYEVEKKQKRSIKDQVLDYYIMYRKL